MRVVGMRPDVATPWLPRPGLPAQSSREPGRAPAFGYRSTTSPLVRYAADPMARPLTGSAAARARPMAGPCSARPGASARAQRPLPERPRGSLRTFASAPRGPNGAHDMTLRFCRLAERAYQGEIDDPTASFIRPAWDAQHRGLLAGQSLMLDLQRMDSRTCSVTGPRSNGSAGGCRCARRIRWRWRGLKRTGRAVFTIGEALFDEEMPDEYGRRIKSVRVRLRGISERSGLGGRLVLLGDRVYFDRDKSEERSVLNLFGRQQIALAGAETDTTDLERQGGRFLPFERCGVHSTWMISFPAAVKAIEDGRRRSRHRTLLEKLEDVVLDIRYTARIAK